MDTETRAGHAWPIAIGGLLRCCIQTIHDCQEQKQEGDTLTCPWCTNQIKLEVRQERTAWRWQRP